MTFYQQQILLISTTVYPKEHVYDQVIAAKNYIDTHFADNLTLHDIAGKAYCSKFHFLRLFKLIYGTTPHQYLTDVRIKRAKELLRTGLPVSEVCFLVGFNSISSFKELFKRCSGFTPFSWRQQLKDKQEISQTAFRFLPFFLTSEKSNFQDSK